MWLGGYRPYKDTAEVWQNYVWKWGNLDFYEKDVDNTFNYMSIIWK